MDAAQRNTYLTKVGELTHELGWRICSPQSHPHSNPSSVPQPTPPPLITFLRGYRDIETPIAEKNFLSESAPKIRQQQEVTNESQTNSDQGEPAANAPVLNQTDTE